MKRPIQARVLLITVFLPSLAGGSIRVQAQVPLRWEHLSSQHGDLPAPEVGRQSAPLVLDVDRDGSDDFLVAGWSTPSMVWFRRAGRSWKRYLVDDRESHVAAGGNLIELEPDILLAWAKWHRLKGDAKLAGERAEEALSIADRCEYRLAQAEIHNFPARLALDAMETDKTGKVAEGQSAFREAAVEHALTAYERAWCDGPPYCYKPALDEAAAMLEHLGVTPPRL